MGNINITPLHILGATLLVAFALEAVDGGHAATAQCANGRRLVWCDEFDGTAYIFRNGGLGRKSKFVPGLTDYLASYPHE